MDSLLHKSTKNAHIENVLSAFGISPTVALPYETGNAHILSKEERSSLSLHEQIHVSAALGALRYVGADHGLPALSVQSVRRRTFDARWSKIVLLPWVWQRDPV